MRNRFTTLLVVAVGLLIASAPLSGASRRRVVWWWGSSDCEGDGSGMVLGQSALSPEVRRDR